MSDPADSFRLADELADILAANELAEWQQRADEAVIARMNRLVAQLRGDGMRPHEIVAALRAARRMTRSKPVPLRPNHPARPEVIGHVLIVQPSGPSFADGTTLHDAEILVFEVQRGDGDDE